MKTLLRTIAAALTTNLKSRKDLVLENLALRQQIEVLQRKGFRLYWTWKSRKRSKGRPRFDRELDAFALRSGQMDFSGGTGCETALGTESDLLCSIFSRLVRFLRVPFSSNSLFKR